MHESKLPVVPLIKFIPYKLSFLVTRVNRVCVAVQTVSVVVATVAAVETGRPRDGPTAAPAQQEHA